MKSRHPLKTVESILIFQSFRTMEMQARVVTERDCHGIFILFVESVCLAWDTWYRHGSCQILSLYMATKSCRSQYLDNVLYAINTQRNGAEGYLFYTESVLEVCQFCLYIWQPNHVARNT